MWEASWRPPPRSQQGFLGGNSSLGIGHMHHQETRAADDSRLSRLGRQRLSLILGMSSSAPRLLALLEMPARQLAWNLGMGASSSSMMLLLPRSRPPYPHLPAPPNPDRCCLVSFDCCTWSQSCAWSCCSFQPLALLLNSNASHCVADVLSCRCHSSACVAHQACLPAAAARFSQLNEIRIRFN